MEEQEHDDAFDPSVLEEWLRQGRTLTPQQMNILYQEKVAEGEARQRNLMNQQDFHRAAATGGGYAGGTSNIMQTTGNTNPGLKLFMAKIKGTRPKLLVPHPARARLPNAAQLAQSVEPPPLSQGFKKGSGGIHINPANKGKFTALQRETGKSTAELKNSPNPLTRKRANFAMMAKRHFKPL